MREIDPWCKGSTTVFGTVSQGSNPCGSTGDSGSLARCCKHHNVRSFDVEGTLSPFLFFEIRIMITVKQVRDLVDQRIEGTDIFVVDITVSAANAIRVTVDADSGVSIDKCIEVAGKWSITLTGKPKIFPLRLLLLVLPNLCSCIVSMLKIPVVI